MIRTAAEAEEAGREFWKKLSPEDRLLLTWQLSEEQSVPFLGKNSLIKNKRASGRLKDLADLEELESL